MKATLWVFAALFAIIGFGVGCDSISSDSAPSDGQTPTAPPMISSVYPHVFYSGAEVKVSGSYLDQATVAVNGAPVTPSYQSAHEVRFFAPKLPAGTYQLEIENAAGDVLREVNYQSALSASIVSSGTAHTCVINLLGGVQCWGRNEDGRLGDGSTTDATAPVTVSGLDNAVSLSAGGGHTCAVTGNGRVQCWGSNSDGQLGDGNGGTTFFEPPAFSLVPVTVSGLSDAVAVFTGDEHSCAVTKTGRVQCWGGNVYGQLGDGSRTKALTPVTVSGLNDVVSVSPAGTHTCALTADGLVRCWGENLYGQLGDGSTTDALTPVTVSGLNDVVAVAAGYSNPGTNRAAHTCAVKGDGSVWCWGANYFGQLGDGSYLDSLTPVMVVGLTNAVSVSAGSNPRGQSGVHTCAVTADGLVQCWGENESGQLGAVRAQDDLTPVTVAGLSDAIAVSAGGVHTCALRSGGRVQCWGGKYSYRMPNGDGSTTNALKPVTVSGLSGAVAVSAGSGHSCALTNDGGAQCWGGSGQGQLGDGSTTNALTPVSVHGLSGALSVSSGNSHSCAVESEGHARCWGLNLSGQLGDGSTRIAWAPVTVSGLSDAVAVSAAGNHSCAVTGFGRVQCWGDNEYGQLGDGSRTEALTPVTVSGLSDMVAVSAGDYHTCAVTRSGIVKCWGSNFAGQLGDGSRTDALTPVTVSDLNDAVAVSADGQHTCVLTSGGRVQCWGDNEYGQLGDGSRTEALTPVTVSGLSDMVEVSAGDHHTCAVTRSGIVKCWGSNFKGQLGGDDTRKRARLTPVTVSGLSGVVSVSAGSDHSCALYHDGAVSCWGSNYYRQAGWPVWNYGLWGVVLEP
jgi:alpha-tubulin suppressor-like RCC1 family protein